VALVSEQAPEEFPAVRVKLKVVAAPPPGRLRASSRPPAVTFVFEIVRFSVVKLTADPPSLRTVTVEVKVCP
ncbi:MAG: hypothetical protein FD127_4538, partial [Acidimicrobiaceae bacterium]